MTDSHAFSTESWLVQIEALHPESFGWALCCCDHDGEKASEVLQISYERVLNGRARYDGRAAFKTWFFGVIRMVSREQRRRSWLAWLRLAPLADAIEVVSPEPPPDCASEQGERYSAVRDALKCLPQRQREVLMLVFYHELTLDAAAEVMGISPGSVRTHYERGKQRMRERLQTMHSNSEKRSI